jgi:hypothetical protein
MSPLWRMASFSILILTINLSLIGWRVTLMPQQALAQGRLKAPPPTGCTPFPKDMWIPLRHLRETYEERGFMALRGSVTEDRCYILEGQNPDGLDVVLTINPVSGKPVREHP